MADSRANRKKKIEGLLAERRKYEAWLAQLEARRADAATHVFDRVHADYSKRLGDVRGELTGEADGLKEMLDGLQSRLGEEERAVSEKTDERAEAELRALVGEFTDKQWDVTRHELDEAIEALRATLEGTQKELDQLKGLLGSMEAPPATPRPSVIQAAVVSVEDDLADARRAEAEKAEAAKPRARATPAPKPADAVESVRSPTPARPADKDGAKAPPAAPEAQPSNDTFDELAFLRSVAAPPTSPRGTVAVGVRAASDTPPPRKTVAEAQTQPREAPRAAAPEVKAPPPEPPPEPEPPAPAPAPPPVSRASQPSSPLGVPTSRSSQAARTLKCQECGTLNFPTEWYCERCGGELAAF